MGMFLIVWDRLFGTFQPELPAGSYQPIRYGLTTPLEREDAATIVFHEWESMRADIGKPGLSFKQKMKYLFGPPGWSHDGSRLTSRQLRAKEVRPEKE
jgi:hypothetical protein